MSLKINEFDLKNASLTKKCIKWIMYGYFLYFHLMVYCFCHEIWSTISEKNHIHCTGFFTQKCHWNRTQSMNHVIYIEHIWYVLWNDAGLMTKIVFFSNRVKWQNIYVFLKEILRGIQIWSQKCKFIHINPFKGTFYFVG